MIGQQLGNYRILRQLGKGGMAGVFVGEHAVLGHEVAVKILHPQFLEDERMRQRFLNEARTVARLEHPSIVEVYDFGYTDSGGGYIVMKRLEGQSLRDRLETGSIELDTALELTRQVARALQVAHDGGVVHRDLKPDNIFLVRDPETRCGERAIVLDFGLAKHVEVEGGVARGGMAAELTGSGFVVGTPAYMSPEQCRGSDELDRRSDIYSLGVVLFRMSTGALPFDADNPGEMLGQHLFVEAPSALNLRPDLPRALDHLLRRCLAKHPDDRFATMNELIAGLALDAQAAPVSKRDQATAALRKPAAAAASPAALPAPRGDDATMPASRVDPAPPAPEPTDEIAPIRRSWLGPALALVLLGGAA
ncbi:MAG TPA: serine/threonine-protein kinase, partial [Kofleriaceae bacterium]|nr:serine/threonine-protein kinase [Kofleriaceae bacterium]